MMLLFSRLLLVRIVGGARVAASSRTPHLVNKQS